MIYVNIDIQNEIRFQLSYIKFDTSTITNSFNDAALDEKMLSFIIKYSLFANRCIYTTYSWWGYSDSIRNSSRPKKVLFSKIIKVMNTE